MCIDTYVANLLTGLASWRDTYITDEPNILKNYVSFILS